MAPFTPSWTSSVALHASSSVADSASNTEDINLSSLGYYAVHVQVSLTSTGTPDGDCVIEVFGSADNGTSDDPEPLQSYAISFSSATTKIFSFVVEGIPYAAVKLTNNSGESATYVANYAGVKQTSA